MTAVHLPRLVPLRVMDHRGVANRVFDVVLPQGPSETLAFHIWGLEIPSSAKLEPTSLQDRVEGALITPARFAGPKHLNGSAGHVLLSPPGKRYDEKPCVEVRIAGRETEGAPIRSQRPRRERAPSIAHRRQHSIAELELVEVSKGLSDKDVTIEVHDAIHGRRESLGKKQAEQGRSRQEVGMVGAGQHRGVEGQPPDRGPAGHGFFNSCHVAPRDAVVNDGNREVAGLMGLREAGERDRKGNHEPGVCRQRDLDRTWATLGDHLHINVVRQAGLLARYAARAPAWAERTTPCNARSTCSPLRSQVTDSTLSAAARALDIRCLGSCDVRPERARASPNGVASA